MIVYVFILRKIKWWKKPNIFNIFWFAGKRKMKGMFMKESEVICHSKKFKFNYYCDKIKLPLQILIFCFLNMTWTCLGITFLFKRTKTDKNKCEICLSLLVITFGHHCQENLFCFRGNISRKDQMKPLLLTHTIRFIRENSVAKFRELFVSPLWFRKQVKCSWSRSIAQNFTYEKGTTLRVASSLSATATRTTNNKHPKR